MVRFSLILLMCLIYMSIELVSNSQLKILYTFVSICVFLSMISLLEKKGRLLTISLFITGIFIHYGTGERGMNLFNGINQNLPLLSILILAPLLLIPLKREGIIATVVSFLNNLKENPRKTFYGISSFMMTLAPILNMGALRIVHQFIENIKFPSKWLSKSYYIGFTPAVLWSPFFASVGIVLYYLHITYLSYVVVGALFAIVQMFLGIFLFGPRKIEPDSNQDHDMNSTPEKVKKKDLFLLLSFVLGIVITLITLEKIFQKSMLFLVSLICLIVPIVWGILRNQKDIIKEEMEHYKDRLLTQSKMEICLFLSAGLFGNAIANTPVIRIIEKGIRWSSTQTVGMLFLFIIIFVTLLAVLGVHQIIAIPLVLTSLKAAEIHIDSVSIAFMCIFTWMISSALSPMNAMNIIISQCVKKDGITVGVKWNGLYFLSITVLAFIYVYLLTWIDDLNKT